MALQYTKQRIAQCYQATINIPFHLRSIVDDQKVISLFFYQFQPNLKEVLGALCKQYPSLHSAILDENGDVQKPLSLYLDDKNVKTLNNLETLLGDSGNTIRIRPALAGG